LNVVAIDVGLKRIGVAVLVSGIAMASEPIFRKNREQASRDVSTMLKEKNASKLIVGIPRGGASEEEMDRRIKHFVSLLAFEGEIIYVDEFGSSREALSEIGGGLTKTKDGRADSLAALVILRRWSEFRG
jgi:putative holliday junction resolvase